jgi:hypothetical protein
MLDFITNNIDKKIASIESTLELKLLSKEERIRNIIAETEAFAVRGNMTVSDETKKLWYSKLDEAKDMTIYAQELREYILKLQEKNNKK